MKVNDLMVSNSTKPTSTSDSSTQTLAGSGGWLNNALTW